MWRGQIIKHLTGQANFKCLTNNFYCLRPWPNEQLWFGKHFKFARQRPFLRATLQSIACKTYFPWCKKKMFLKFSTILLSEASISFDLTKTKLKLNTFLPPCLWFTEYDTLQRLGISDGRQFLKRRLKQEEDSLLFLPTCCVGKTIQDHIEAVIDETMTSASWVHVKVWTQHLIILSTCSVFKGSLSPTWLVPDFFTQHTRDFIAFRPGPNDQTLFV